MSTLDKLILVTQDTLGYLWGGLSRIFSPPDDAYPNTGVQPYEGVPSGRGHKKHKF